MIKEILLAIVQGITEFLPISSSGHLALLGKFFSEVNFSIFIYLHIASFLAVLIFFRKKIKDVILNDRKKLAFVIVGIIPAAFIGFLFKNFVEKSFNSLFLIGISFLITAIFLFLTKFRKEERKLDLKSSLLIGLFQILALFPGISRSGITISSARILGIKKEEAFDFSFLMFIPLSFGAFLVEISENSTFILSTSFFIPFLVCFFVSYFSLVYLNKILKKGKLWFFGVYCLLIGIFSLIFSFFFS
ncbi:MAG: undecaprenyl-diphosphate phosphatase [Candidatus Pacearchaeota archaeon]